MTFKKFPYSSYRLCCWRLVLQFVLWFHCPIFNCITRSGIKINYSFSKLLLFTAKLELEL